MPLWIDEINERQLEENRSEVLTRLHVNKVSVTTPRIHRVSISH